MNQIIHDNSITNNAVSTIPVIIENKRVNNGYAFCRKVTKCFFSTRNCLMLISSTIAGITIGTIATSQASKIKINEYDNCKPTDARNISLVFSLNTMLPTFLCMVLYAIIDASEPKADDHGQENNSTSTIIIIDKNSNDEENIEKNMENCSLVEDQQLVSKLLKKIKSKMINIKNDLKNIHLFEVFIYFVLMLACMLIIFGIEYAIFSSCEQTVAFICAIFVPTLALLVFGLPVMVVKISDRMSTN
jgi:cytochrome c oxidase subunit IV